MSDEIEIKELIRRCNAAIIERKRMLRRPHGDDTPAVQRLLHRLAWMATVLHVSQATRRGRRHGGMFETLDAQRAWLDAAAVSVPAGDLAAAAGWPSGRPVREVLAAA